MPLFDLVAPWCAASVFVTSLLACGARSALEQNNEGGAGNDVGAAIGSTSAAPSASTSVTASTTSASTSSGAPAPAGPCWSETLAVDDLGGQHLTFMDPERLAYISRAGRLVIATFSDVEGEAASQEVYSAQASLGALTAHENHVYYDDLTLGEPFFADLDVASATTVINFGLRLQPTAMVADDSGTYVADQSAVGRGRILRFAHVSGAIETVLEPVGIVRPWPLVLAGDDLVTVARASAQAPDHDGTITVAKNGSGATAILAGASGAVSHLHVDRQLVYFTDSDDDPQGTSSVRRVPLAGGGAMETLATLPGIAQGITSDAGHFYVTSISEDGGVRESTLYALPRSTFGATAIFTSRDEDFGRVEVAGGRIAWVVSATLGIGPSVRVACAPLAP